MARKPRDEAPSGAEPARPPVTIDLPASAIAEAQPDPKPGDPAEPAAAAAESPKAESRETASGDAENGETEKRNAEMPRQAEPPLSPPPPPARTSKALPAFLGLVAGALGGFAAWHVTDFLNPRPQPVAVQPGPGPAAFAALETRLKGIEEVAKSPAAPPAIPPAVADRLGKAETALAEAARREAALKAEIDRLAAGLQAESASREKAVAELAARPPALLPLTGQPSSGDDEARAAIEQLRARLGQIETGARALPEAVSRATQRSDAAASRVESIAPRVEAVTGRIEQIAPKLEQVGGDVADLGKKVAALAGRDQLARAASVQAATAILDEAFARGEALAGPLGVLANLGVPQVGLAPFQPFAERGAPGAAALLAELKAIQPRQPEPKPSGDLMERLKAGAMSLVEIRQTGEITGTDDAAHLGRAEQALQRGDIATALTLVSRLSAQRAEAYAPWRARAEARLKAGEALAGLKRTSLAELAKAAGGAK